MAILRSMDEILIDEKKYVSSKRAAKATGYAKDYIGQLCREGRVPARLVGRSWYVLESAIHDHRFGTQKIEGEISKKEQIVKESPLKFQSTWESPRYEAATIDVLPSINRLRSLEEGSKASKTTSQELLGQKEVVEHLQNSWNSMLNKESTAADPEVSDQTVDNQKGEAIRSVSEDRPSITLEDEGEPVPVHTIYELPPENLLPLKKENQSPDAYREGELKERTTTAKRIGVRIARLAVLMALFLAVFFAAVAILGSGYVDNIVTSFKQVHEISGINVYNK